MKTTSTDISALKTKTTDSSLCPDKQVSSKDSNLEELLVLCKNTFLN